MWLYVNRFDEKSIFSFKEIGKTEVIKEIKTLDIKKGSLFSDIPTKIINEFDDFYSQLLLPKNFLLLKFLQFIWKQTRSSNTTTDQ